MLFRVVPAPLMPRLMHSVCRNPRWHPCSQQSELECFLVVTDDSRLFVSASGHKPPTQEHLMNISRTTILLCLVALSVATQSKGQGLVLSANRGTGALSVRNASAIPMAIDGYTIGSAD